MLKKYYRWYQVTEDQLVEPFARVTAYYPARIIGNLNGFETEEEAVIAYERFIGEYGESTPYQLVLLTEYEKK